MTECSGRFFAAFDSSRSSLLPVYAPQATLSHNFTYTIPRRRVKSEVTVAPGKTSWDHWNPTNRNLIRIGKPRRTNTLVVSDERSLTAWLLNTIPATKHPLDDPTKWMYDVLPLDAVGGVGRIMLTIHGEFVEGMFDICLWAIEHSS
jgi:nuclear RNA export factor